MADLFARPDAPASPTVVEPTDLDVAIRVAQEMLVDYGDSRRDGFTYPAAYGATREALRLLLRALGAEPVDPSFAAEFPTIAAHLAAERGGRQ